eukprot:3587675-Rhodomonas_salina.2
MEEEAGTGDVSTPAEKGNSQYRTPPIAVADLRTAYPWYQPMAQQSTPTACKVVALQHCRHKRQDNRRK